MRNATHGILGTGPSVFNIGQLLADYRFKAPSAAVLAAGLNQVNNDKLEWLWDFSGRGKHLSHATLPVPIINGEATYSGSEYSDLIDLGAPIYSVIVRWKPVLSSFYMWAGHFGLRVGLGEITGAITGENITYIPNGGILRYLSTSANPFNIDCVVGHSIDTGDFSKAGIWLDGQMATLIDGQKISSLEDNFRFGTTASPSGINYTGTVDRILVYGSPLSSKNQTIGSNLIRL